MNGDITLISVKVGLSSNNQDHVLRQHQPNTESTDIDILMEAKLGNSGRVSPLTLEEVSARSGGLNMQASGAAYIEDGGWALSRGLCQMEFITSDNVYNQEKLVILGYIAGGEISYADGIDPNYMFVPIRMWNFKTEQHQDHMGLPVARSSISQAAQFLMNDPTSNTGLFAIRPKDIIETSAGVQAMRDQDMAISGGDNAGEDDFTGTNQSILSVSGLALSNVRNNSPIHYAKALLESSLLTQHQYQQTRDPYMAINESVSGTNIREMNYRDNAFVNQMRNHLGQTSTAMSGFEGYSFGEIAHVFENFTDVLSLESADDYRFEVADNRLNTSEFGTSNLAEVICNELVMLSQWLLIENSISLLSITGTNNVMEGEYDINGLPVDYQAGEIMPITDGLDVDYIATIENIKMQLTNLFFGKHCSIYTYSRKIVDFRAELVLFGESTVSVMLDGDPNTERKHTFCTYALNRFDPNLASKDNSVRATKNFFQNLSDHFNFN